VCQLLPENEALIPGPPIASGFDTAAYFDTHKVKGYIRRSIMLYVFAMGTTVSHTAAPKPKRYTTYRGS